MWSAFAQFAKNADAELADGAGAIGLQAVRRNWRPGNKGPADLTDMVEHIAPLRHALGPRLASMGIFNHMLSNVVAQTVDLILVTVFEHAGEVRHARLKAIESIATGRFKVCNLRQRPI